MADPIRTVWTRMTQPNARRIRENERGSTRKYGQAVREFTEAYGLEKSAVSEHFIEASRAKLKGMMERRLEQNATVRLAD